MPEQSNIVLIVADQWRGDCLSIAGHPVVHTPFLDRLASDGVRFTRAYSATPTCIPARASLYTGMGQRTHGRVGYQDCVPWDYPVTIASEFTRNDYQTQAIGKLHVYPERSQMGFQNVVLHSPLGIIRYNHKRGIAPEMVDDYVPWLREQLGRDSSFYEHGVDSNSYVARPWDKPEHLHPTNFVTTQSIDFLRRRDPRKPFFLMMSFNAPHPPYDPPEWSFDQYLHRTMPDVPVGDWTEILAPYAEPNRSDCKVAEIDPELLQRARAGYYGHMTHVDHQINRFLEALDQFDLRSNTYICFVSDHGEMLGDHHMFRKGYPYEGSAHVPLILNGPYGSGIRTNATSEQVVELRDVMPTLLECAGLPVSDTVEGRSLLPMARGEDVRWRSYLHGEHVMFGQSLQWITDGHEKYIWFSGTGREQLFNLDDDPAELRDLAKAPESRGDLVRWRNALMAELAGRAEGFTDGHRLIPGRPVNACLPHLRDQAGSGH